jgi:hypothetical protein
LVYEHFKTEFILASPEDSPYVASLFDRIDNQTVAELIAMKQALENYITQGFDADELTIPEVQILNNLIEPEGAKIHQFILAMREHYGRDYFTTQQHLTIQSQKYDNYGAYILELARNPLMHFAQALLDRIQVRLQAPRSLALIATKIKPLPPTLGYVAPPPPPPPQRRGVPPPPAERHAPPPPPPRAPITGTGSESWPLGPQPNTFGHQFSQHVVRQGEIAQAARGRATTPTTQMARLTVR